MFPLPWKKWLVHCVRLRSVHCVPEKIRKNKKNKTRPCFFKLRKNQKKNMKITGKYREDFIDSLIQSLMYQNINVMCIWSPCRCLEVWYICILYQNNFTGNAEKMREKRIRILIRNRILIRIFFRFQPSSFFKGVI